MVMTIIFPHQNASCGDARPHTAVALLAAAICGKSTKIDHKFSISPDQVSLHVLARLDTDFPYETP
jgi:hypothetical protein